MSTYSEKKLGLHQLNLAYDLRDIVNAIYKALESHHAEAAQELLDLLKEDVESYLLVLQALIIRQWSHDSTRSGIQHLQSGSWESSNEFRVPESGAN